MSIITAQQAAENAKGLTFEIVWAALMENRQQMQESEKKTDKILAEMSERSKNTEKALAEMSKNTAEFSRDTKQIMAELSKNIGGVNNSLGRLSEGLFSVGLDEKFNELGYPFTKQGPHVKFKENGKVIAEADYLLENGDYAMAVEVKTDLKQTDVDDHMQRIAAIRRYFNARADKRVLVGAVAGVMVRENVLNYARGQGLYVLTLKGDAVTVADLPKDFKAREWK